MSTSITDKIKAKIDELLRIQGEINILSASLSATSGLPKPPSPGLPKPPPPVLPKPPSPPGPHSLVSLTKLLNINRITCKNIFDWYTQDIIYKAPNILELITDYSRDNHIDQQSVESCIRFASPTSFEYNKLKGMFKVNLDTFASEWKKPAADDDDDFVFD